MGETRFRHADAKRAYRAPVDSATVVEIGDLMWLDTDDVKPAADQASVADAATAQSTFAGVFAGVAMDASEDGEDRDIVLARQGVFEYDIASGTFELFAQVGVAATAGGDINDSQTISSGAADAGTIGFITRRYGAATTRVLVEIDVKAARGLS